MEAVHFVNQKAAVSCYDSKLDRCARNLRAWSRFIGWSFWRPHDTSALYTAVHFLCLDAIPLFPAWALPHCIRPSLVLAGFSTPAINRAREIKGGATARVPGNTTLPPVTPPSTLKMSFGFHTHSNSQSYHQQAAASAASGQSGTFHPAPMPTHARRAMESGPSFVSPTGGQMSPASSCPPPLPNSSSTHGVNWEAIARQLQQENQMLKSNCNMLLQHVQAVSGVPPQSASMYFNPGFRADWTARKTHRRNLYCSSNRNGISSCVTPTSKSRLRC